MKKSNILRILLQKKIKLNNKIINRQLKLKRNLKLKKNKLLKAIFQIYKNKKIKLNMFK